MEKVYMDRLLKLAAFLDKMKPSKFDYSTIYDTNCKTTGCAMGWCPVVFPGSFQYGEVPFEKNTKYDEDNKEVEVLGYGVCLKSKPVKTPGFRTSILSAQKFFGLTKDESHALFASFNEDWDVKKLPGLKVLGLNATAKQVASHIRNFVKLKKEGKI